ncbi:succinate dehydrogenase/fumarate reductase iron-sulfur subunit [Bdellovibrionota bacterium FG-2]
MSDSTQSMTLTLLVWRQEGPHKPGALEKFTAKNISSHMSFLEMLDFVNEDIIKAGRRPIEFDSDCREGICGCCGVVINGQPHGPDRATATCQLHMRTFKDGDTIVIEPWRAKAFPIIKDLVVDRGALDRVMSAGGFVSVKTGPHADGNAMLIPKPLADLAMDAASCIGCGACVAACPNASAALFTSAKISQLALLPQGQPEAARRATGMVEQMDKEGFGNCTNIGECRAACPKEVSIDFIAKMKREYFKAMFAPMESAGGDGGV